MILVDFNQIVLASLHAALGKHAAGDIEIDPFRNMVANVLRKNNSRFRKQYGPMVLAVDSKSYWRKDSFPFYKASRKKRRDESKLNWPEIFRCLDIINQELQTRFPYKYICVPGAEADDIIGVLCKHATEPVLILSRDEDFLQLHNSQIRQYDTVNEKFLSCPDPAEFLRLHIMSGDYGDGIPNIKCPDNHYVASLPIKKITTKFLASMNNIENEPDNPYYANYQRNKRLIDLSYTPQDIQDQILLAFEAPVQRTRKDLNEFFIERRMKDQLDYIHEF